MTQIYPGVAPVDPSVAQNDPSPCRYCPDELGTSWINMVYQDSGWSPRVTPDIPGTMPELHDSSNHSQLFETF